MPGKHLNVSTEIIGESHEGQNLKILKICNGACEDNGNPIMWIQSGEQVQYQITWYCIKGCNPLLRNSRQRMDYSGGKHISGK